MFCMKIEHKSRCSIKIFYYTRKIFNIFFLKSFTANFLLLCVFWEFLILPINNDSTTLQKTLIPKVLKLTCRKLYVYLHLPKINFIIRFSLEILRKSYNMITEIIWELESKLCLPSLSQDLVGLTKKINISLCTCWQKLHSIP